MHSAVLIAQQDVGRLDQQLSTVGHRVPGVDREVDHDLLQLVLVPIDRRHVGSEGRFDSDAVDPKLVTEKRDDVLTEARHREIRQWLLTLSADRQQEVITQAAFSGDGELVEAVLNAPAVFGFLKKRGKVARAEMERVFNMGIGLCVIVSPALDLAAVPGLDARVVGEGTAGEAGAALTALADRLEGRMNVDGGWAGRIAETRAAAHEAIARQRLRHETAG